MPRVRDAKSGERFRRVESGDGGASGRAGKNHRGEAEVLREFLAARPSACPACGYELGEVRDGRCPECGAALRLVLTARRSAREAVSGRLWLIGLVGPCTAVGVLTLDLARVVIAWWVALPRGGGPALGGWTIWNRVLLLAGAVLLMYFIVEMREAMSRQHPLVAMILAQSAWVLAVGLLAVNQYVFV